LNLATKYVGFFDNIALVYQRVFYEKVLLTGATEPLGCVRCVGTNA